MTSSQGANEFTPLLPAHEDNPPDSNPPSYETTRSTQITSISEPTTTQDFVPVLPQQEQLQAQLQLESRELRNRTSRAAISATHGSRDGAITTSALEDGFGLDLSRQRSRLGSYPVLAEPEDIKRRDSVFVDAIESEDTGSHGGDEAPENASNSKYMRVGPVRFWFVFITVLLGMMR
jgi:hypothetical protein